MPPPPRPPPEELVEEVLLRFPPDDPARLVRAALVCRGWCRLVSGPAFRRRYREFHRAPPVLGFFFNFGIRSYFVRTASTCPPLRRNWPAIDARHGRVLRFSATSQAGEVPLEKPLVVWDPVTGQRRQLPVAPGSFRPDHWNGAVLCASAAACDHLDCHRGPFLVVLVGTTSRGMLACVYSSEAGAWSEPTSAQNQNCSVAPVPSALVGNALHFQCGPQRSVLRYDLGTRRMSVIHLPADCPRHIALMTTEGGGLGFADIVSSTLYLWSWEASRDEAAGWEESRSIELKNSLPARADPTSLRVVGCADSIGVIFVYSDVGILTVDLKSCRVTKV
ncbi:hypothetical protein U9M48_011479 [Paspalum notatum var. saurae]|uniref:F-box domain-containing protein n=1 Tax=Paspalum notatum var. saurae TaxID=547442 RepID=A0AAQ3WHP4_PASNO